MATPPFTYKEVVGKYLAPDGDPVAGQIRFQPSTTVMDFSGNVVVPPTPIAVTLDGAGEFTIDLLVTDDAQTTPTGWTWDVRELFAGGRSWSFQLPSSLTSPVQIATLAPAIATPSETWQFASLAALGAVDGRLVIAEADIVNLDSRADAVDAHLDILDSDVDGLDARLTNAESSLAPLEVAAIIHPFLLMGA